MKNVSPTGSVTIWLAELKAGDPAAAKPLWDSYFTRLVRLARARLWAVPRVAADEEDVALSAFDSFCRSAASGRFPRLNDRDDLWQVLFVITTRKAIDLVRRVKREINGSADFMSAVAAREPLPEVVAEVTEACVRLLGLLGDKGELRSVAIWKMEGYTNAEIAEKLSKSIPTVERKLARIRTIWAREAVR